MADIVKKPKNKPQEIAEKFAQNNPLMVVLEPEKPVENVAKATLSNDAEIIPPLLDVKNGMVPGPLPEAVLQKETLSKPIVATMQLVVEGNKTIVKVEGESPLPAQALFKFYDGWYLVFAMPMDMMVPTSLLTEKSHIQQIRVSKSERVVTRQETPPIAMSPDLSASSPSLVSLPFPAQASQVLPSQNIATYTPVDNMGKHDYLLVKIQTDRPLQASIVSLVPNAIAIHFMDDPEKTQGYPLIIRPSDKNPGMILPFENGEEVLSVYDADAGESFWVVPAFKGNEIRYDVQEFPDFRLLTCAQGLVVHLKRDDIDAFWNDKKLNLSADRGLFATTQEQLNQERQSFLIPSVFSSYKQVYAQARRHEIEALLIEKPLEDVIPDVLELVWTHLGLGNIPEAMANLNSLEEVQPPLKNAAFFAILKGISYLLMNRFEAAAAALEPFYQFPEPKLWFQLAISHLPQKNTADGGGDKLSELINLKPILNNLPLAMKEQLIEMILTLAIAAKNKAVLEAYIQPEFLPKNKYRRAVFKLGQAAFAHMDEQPTTEDLLKSLIKNKDAPQVAIMAQFELILYKFNKKLMKQDEVIKKLEKLRFQWRGDDLEYRITRFLSHLYWESGNYPKALPLFRSLIKYYPEQSQKDHLGPLIQEGLMRYFKKDPPPPLMESLSFFQEFGDAAPDSLEGDAVMMAAIQRLAEIGLYGEGARILRKYYNNKIKIGTQDIDRSAKIIYSIAELMLMDREPEKALKMLKKIKEWPENQLTAVEDLQAKAFISSEKFDEALSVLGDKPVHYDLKAQIYFRRKQWDKAAPIYESILNQMQGDEKADKKVSVISDLALCYAMQKNMSKLKDLKEKQGQFMNTTAEKDTFNFLTGPVQDENKLSEITKAAQTADFLKKIYGG